MEQVAKKSKTNNTIKKKRKNVNSFSKLWDSIFTVLLGLFAFACVFPFVYIVIISFTDEKTLAANGYRFFPEKFSLEAYKLVFDSGSSLFRSYGVTLFVTIVGTILALIVISLYAYALSRQSFKYRNFFNTYAFITMLFSGGLVPSYVIITRMLNLRNSIWALILPLCCSAWYILVLRTFFKTSVPDAIIESAKIDGASEFRAFLQVVLPISLPGIATIALFCTLGYWNDWYTALLYIDVEHLIPMQYMLMKLENNIEFLKSNINIGSADVLAQVAEMPKETAKMAMVVLATTPILIAYPFFQRYFIQGLTIGAVKG